MKMTQKCSQTIPKRQNHPAWVKRRSVHCKTTQMTHRNWAQLWNCAFIRALHSVGWKKRGSSCAALLFLAGSRQTVHQAKSNRSAKDM